MKCKAIIFNQRKIGRCPHDAVKGKHFCSSHKYYLLVIIISPVILFMLGYLGNKLLDVIFVSDSSPFVANIQIVDWNGEINNRDIKEELYYGATLYLDNNPQKLSGSIVKFSDLPASYNKKDVRVHFEPKPEYQFMQLDTIICINRNSPTYRLRMRFKGAHHSQQFSQSMML
ncbi:hypothetical protein [Dysgonomonas sp. 511]|uniref:hypothetical protein n=1 Tax=Dysgonomonas sp. 511 TaxID=2302930 RepID=UPI0013D2B8BF|nr:hypothetical protein [Dysgonomonas sp. 511]